MEKELKDVLEEVRKATKNFQRYQREERAEIAMGHADDAEENGEHQCVVDALLGRENA